MAEKELLRSNEIIHIVGIDNESIANEVVFNEDNTIRAVVIEWLFFKLRSITYLPIKSISLQYINVTGKLNLNNSKLCFNLVFQKCSIIDGIELNYSSMQNIQFIGCDTGSINAYFSKIGLVKIQQSIINGEINLSGSEINGLLLIKFVNISNNGNATISINEASIKGMFCCEYLISKGHIQACMINVSSIIKILHSEIISDGEIALSLDGANINGSVFLNNGFKASGEIRFINSSMQNIYLSGAILTNPGKQTFVADNVLISDELRCCDGFQSNGKISLQNASIKGNVTFDNAKLSNPNNYTLLGSGTEFGQNVYFINNCLSEGEINLVGSRIKADLICESSSFSSPNHISLALSQMNLRTMFLRHIKATGIVNISGSTINNSLIIDKYVDFSSASLDLTNSIINTLSDTEESWPAKNNLFINGLIYNNIGYTNGKEKNDRISWIKLQPDICFSTQPYQQLANVLYLIGNEEYAKETLITKNIEYDKHSRMHILKRLWRNIFRLFVNYGYDFDRLVAISIAIVLFGALLAGAGFKTQILSPVSSLQRDCSFKDKSIPEFIVYSLDLFIPVLDLDFAKNWHFDPNQTKLLTIYDCKDFFLAIPLNGQICRNIAWLISFLGWFICIILVAGISNIMKNKK